jgi:hypothetical protein
LLALVARRRQNSVLVALRPIAIMACLRGSSVELHLQLQRRLRVLDQQALVPLCTPLNTLVEFGRDALHCLLVLLVHGAHHRLAVGVGALALGARR